MKKRTLNEIRQEKEFGYKPPVDKKIKFLDAWVHEEHRLKGVFRMLWDTRWEYVKTRYSGYTVYAWCKPSSLPLLLEKEFNVGETCTYVEKVIN